MALYETSWTKLLLMTEAKKKSCFHKWFKKNVKSCAIWVCLQLNGAKLVVQSWFESIKVANVSICSLSHRRSRLYANFVLNCKLSNFRLCGQRERLFRLAHDLHRQAFLKLRKGEKSLCMQADVLIASRSTQKTNHSSSSRLIVKPWSLLSMCWEQITGALKSLGGFHCTLSTGLTSHLLSKQNLKGKTEAKARTKEPETNHWVRKSNYRIVNEFISLRSSSMRLENFSQDKKSSKNSFVDQNFTSKLFWIKLSLNCSK